MEDQYVKAIDVSLTPLQRVQRMWHDFAYETNVFDTTMWKTVELEEVDEARHRVSFTMTVTEPFCSNYDSLHGAAAGMLLDCITTSAVMTVAREGFWENLGVSRSMSTVFLRPLFTGTKVRIEGEVVHAGRKSICLSGRISRVSDGKVAVTCVQDKVPLEIKPNL